MEWNLLCDYYNAATLILKALGYQRIDSISSFWEKESDWAHLTLSPYNGVKLVVNGECRVHLAQHPKEGK